MNLAIASLLAWLALGVTTPDSVRAAADKAAVLVSEGRYAEAMATLEKAEKERADPVFVFMRGVVEEEQGNCEAAVAHYDRFLDLEIPEVDAKEARRRRERCERLLRTPPQGPAGPPPTPTPTPTPPPPRPPPRPWYADPAGVTLTAVGIAGLAVGAGVYTQARADARAARSASVLELYDSRATRAERWSRAGIATMATAGAVLVAGIVRYAIVGARIRRGRPAKGSRAHATYSGTLARLR